MMPAFIRLIISVTVLLIIEGVVLSFTGINQPISGTSISMGNIAVFFIGLTVAFIVLKYGHQLSSAVYDAYKAYRTWTPLLGYFFQLVFVVILYAVTNALVSTYFLSAPWVIPLIFLLMALIPTFNVTTNIVRNFEGPTKDKHNEN
jgi:hypothetical protein